MNRYPLWINLLVIAVVLVGALYAFPNVYDQDPSIEIAGTRLQKVDASTEAKVKETLEEAGECLLRFSRAGAGP